MHKLSSDSEGCSASPRDVDRVGPEPLSDGGLLERSLLAHAERQETGLGDHDAVVDAEAENDGNSTSMLHMRLSDVEDQPLVRREDVSVPLGSHDPHHLL